MDELADKLGMDPMALRQKNDSNEVRRKMVEMGAEKIGWHRRNKTPGAGTDVKKRGLGMGSGECQEASVVLGGVAPIPWRVPETEQLLKGKRITEALAVEAAEAAVQGADQMTDNAYKVQLTQNIVKQVVLGVA